MKRPLSEKHCLLHKHHDDVARLMVSDENPFFWVLDLDDEIGFQLALPHSGKTPAQLTNHRAATLEAGNIAALTLATTLEVGNRLLADLWSVAPVAAGIRCCVVVSDGRVSVRGLQ